MAAGGIEAEARLAVTVVFDALPPLGLAEDRPGAMAPTNAVSAAVRAPAPAATAQRVRVTRASIASRRN